MLPFTTRWRGRKWGVVAEVGGGNARLSLAMIDRGMNHSFIIKSAYLAYSQHVRLRFRRDGALGAVAKPKGDRYMHRGTSSSVLGVAEALPLAAYAWRAKALPRRPRKSRNSVRVCLGKETRLQGARFARVSAWMSAMIFLAGAPLSSVLNWEDGALSAPLLNAFKDTRNEHSHINGGSKNDIGRPAWRLLPLTTNFPPSGLSQESVYLDENLVHSTMADIETSFLMASGLPTLPDDSCLEGTVASMPSDASSDDALSQFYEHSFVAHEDIPASNVMTFVSSDDQYFSSPINNSLTDQELPSKAPSALKPRSTRLNTLREIPNDRYLHALEPQTVTVDLVIGVLHILPPRAIKTRRYNRWVELVEIIVADDTKAGFGISIWLSQYNIPKPRKTQEHDLRSQVTKLRPRDIVLVKNLALASFQKKVHGQSLRKASTTLDLLYRNLINANDEPGAYSRQELNTNEQGDLQLDRVKKVQDWMMSFVGSGHLSPENGRRGPSGKSRLLQQLPSDTP